MTQQNGNRKKHHRLGSGWKVPEDKGKAVVSFSVNPKYNKGVVLYARNEKGEEVEVNNLYVFDNEYKEQETHPDYTLTFTTSEE